MTSSSDLKDHHISIFYFCNKVVRSIPVIHRETSISLRTIYYNINKLKQIDSLKHRRRNGRLHMLSAIEKKAIDQYIQRNNETTINEIGEKLWTTYHSSASAATICRHLYECGYRNALLTMLFIVGRNILTCHTFKCILNGPYYVYILKNFLPAVRPKQ